MSKFAAKKAGQGAMKGGGAAHASAPAAIERHSRSGEFRPEQVRFEIVMKAAERSGLLNEKSSRIAGRVSPALVEQAKRRTGIAADTDLIAFALANVALEDNFAETFKDARGKVGAGVKLGF